MTIDLVKQNQTGKLKLKRDYIPDLSAFMSLCDANYAKMMQLLPYFETEDVRVFGLSRKQHDLGKIRIEIIERCRYTTTLKLFQEDTSLKSSTCMEVRLYHDARMAEVMSYQGVGKLRASYSYPNDRMFQKDEKALCNEFLADWLSYCLKFGHSVDDIHSL